MGGSLTEMILGEVLETPVAPLSGLRGLPAEHRSSLRASPSAYTDDDLLAFTVLGACLSSAEYMEDAAERLRADVWPLEWQRRVWRLVLELRAQGQAVDLRTLVPALDAWTAGRVLKACAERQSPYGADYVGLLAQVAEGRAITDAAAALAAEAMEASR